ncbi:hypothetical protein EV1_001544 [Malus domestica]
MASRKIWYSWRHQIGFLAKHGYHVVAPDMRGYGDTDAPLNPTSYSILHLVDDLVGLLDHFGGQQTFVVGHDHGALGKEKRENQPKKKQKQKAKDSFKSEDLSRVREPDDDFDVLIECKDVYKSILDKHYKYLRIDCTVFYRVVDLRIEVTVAFFLLQVFRISVSLFGRDAGLVFILILC